MRASSSWPLISSSSLPLVLLLWSPAAQGSGGGSRGTCSARPLPSPALLRSLQAEERDCTPLHSPPALAVPAGALRQNMSTTWSLHSASQVEGILPEAGITNLHTMADPLSTSHSCSGSQLQHMAPNLFQAYFSSKKKKNLSVLKAQGNLIFLLMNARDEKVQVQKRCS